MKHRALKMLIFHRTNVLRFNLKRVLKKLNRESINKY